MSSQRNHFDVFGLPPRFALDPAVLEERYRAESMRWHPDRHSRAPAGDRAQVLQRATDINDAYRVLKSAQRRAEYLLLLHGIDIAAESGPARQPVDPTLLHEVLELREQIQEARSARDRAALVALQRQVQGSIEQMVAKVAALFERLDGGDRAVLPEIAGLLIALRYYTRLQAELDDEEERVDEL